MFLSPLFAPRARELPLSVGCGWEDGEQRGAGLLLPCRPLCGGGSTPEPRADLADVGCPPVLGPFVPEPAQLCPRGCLGEAGLAVCPSPRAARGTAALSRTVLVCEVKSFSSRGCQARLRRGAPGRCAGGR